MDDSLLKQPPPGAATKQVALSLFLAALVGSIVSVNVFTVPVESSASPPHALDGIWPFSTGLCYFLAALVSVPAGFLLDDATDKTVAGKTLCVAGAVGFCLFAGAAFAVQRTSVLLTSVGVAALSVPLGVLGVLAMEHIAVWMPGSIGAAVGIATVSRGMGTVLAACFYHTLLQNMSVSSAILVVAALFTLLTLFPATFLLMPPRQASGAAEVDEEAARPLLATSMYPKLSIRDMVRLRSFWLYVFVMVTRRYNFPMLAYYFRIGHSYGRSDEALLDWYQVGTILAMVFNLLSSVVSDVAHTRSGPLCSGARNLAILMLFLQTSAFSLLTVFVHREYFVGWVRAITVMRVLIQSDLGLSALLAADIFGPENMALVYGVGGGLALGVGGGLSTVIMSVVDNMNPGDHSPMRYKPFYVIGVVWSTVALFSLMFMRRNGKTSK